MTTEITSRARSGVPARSSRESILSFPVLDEEPGAPAPASGADAGSDETPEERLQASDHFVRIAIWDVSDGVHQLAEVEHVQLAHELP